VVFSPYVFRVYSATPYQVHIGYQVPQFILSFEENVTFKVEVTILGIRVATE